MVSKNKKKVPKKKQTTVKSKTIKKKKISKKATNKSRIVKKSNLSNFNHYGIKDNNINYDSLVVSEKTIIKGSVLTQKTILIFGEVHGTVKAINVHLAKGAKVTGMIIAENIYIEGNCGAEIQVNKFCHIKSTAIIKADIKYDDNISIDKGARILGQLIPKKKPLALPDYSHENIIIENSKSTKADSNDHSYTSTGGPQLNIIKKKDDSFDKIIKKIFK